MKKYFLLFILVIFCIPLCSCGGTESKLKTAINNSNTYTMDLDYDNDNHTLSATQTLAYTNRTDTILDFLIFHLYPNNFSVGAVNVPVGVLSIDKAYPNGKSYGNIQIVSVNTYEYEILGQDNDFLKIFINGGIKPDQNLNITIEYNVKLPNINHRFGYGNDTINLANFYPVLAIYENGEWIMDSYNYNGDPFYTDVSNYNVTFTSPSNLVLSSTGTIEKNSTDGIKTTYHILANGVRDFAMVMSDEFECISTQIDDVNIKYYYYNDLNYEKNLQTAVDSVVTFSNLFGTYPYSSLSVVKCDFVHGGMEYPMLIYISDDLSDEADYTNVIIHETAHQWWYGVVGNNEFKYGWLDEGLTEFSTALFYENNSQYGVNYNDLVKATTNSYATFVDLYTSVLGSVDTSLNRELDEYDTEPEYVYMAYVKGMLFFANLRETLGDKKFFKSLKAYYNNYAFENVTPDHLLYIFEKTTKTDLHGYFDSWINGKISIINA